MGTPRVSVAERLAVLRDLLRRGSFSLDDALHGADRVTVCVTVFALLEPTSAARRRGSSDEPFAEITVHAAATGEEAAA